MRVARMSAAVVGGVLSIALVGFLLMAGAAAAVADGSGGLFGVGSATVAGTLAGATPTPALGTMVEVPATLLPGVPAGGHPTRTYEYGQCTYWAALNHRVTWTADAYQWTRAAGATGATIVIAPVVGSIAVYARGNGYDALHGHVALVVAVGMNAYTVSEMNVLRPSSGAVDERTIPWPDTHVEGFIV